MSKIVDIENLKVQYSKLNNPTLVGVNFCVEKNQKVLVAGVSGSGKSTLAKVINGLIPNSYKAKIEGSININNLNPTKEKIHVIAENVSTILQDQDAQFIGTTVYEDIAFLMENDCVPVEEIKEKIKKSVEIFDIKHLLNESPESLSGGQKQMVSLAGLVNSKANIMVFDEPLANLDPISSSKILKVMDDLVKEHNKTVIIIEHRLEECMKYDLDKVVLIDEKTIKFEGNVNELLKSNVLDSVGIRKPMYMEYLQLKNIDYSKIKNLADISTFKFDIKLNNKYNKDILKSNEILKINNLCFSYGNNKIFEQNDFTISSNEITLFVGKNGSGKSTLAKIINGINKIDKGNIYVNDIDITKDSIYDKTKHIGYVLQNPNYMISEYTVEEEISSYLTSKNLTKNVIEEKVNNVLEKCGLTKYKKWPIESLSYGQKRRVTIASVLVTNPSILILDEPTAGQDYKTYKSIMDFILTLKDKKTAIIIITHNMELCLEYGDKAYVFGLDNFTKYDVVDLLTNTKLLHAANLEESSLSQLANVNNLNKKDLLIDYLNIRRDND